jgi:hypothetical protein
MQETNSQIEIKPIEKIQQAVRLLLVPGHVYELRCPKAGKYKTISGYFNDFDALAAEAEAHLEQRWGMTLPAERLTGT